MASLLEIAREASNSQTTYDAWAPWTHEHYELAVALLKGEVTRLGFCKAIGNSNAPDLLAWRMLQDGVRRGRIVVAAYPQTSAELPRVCDGGVA